MSESQETSWDIPDSTNVLIMTLFDPVHVHTWSNTDDTIATGRHLFGERVCAEMDPGIFVGHYAVTKRDELHGVVFDIENDQSVPLMREAYRGSPYAEILTTTHQSTDSLSESLTVQWYTLMISWGQAPVDLRVAPLYMDFPEWALYYDREQLRGCIENGSYPVPIAVGLGHLQFRIRDANVTLPRQLRHRVVRMD